jgi:hypothetical protein
MCVQYAGAISGQATHGKRNEFGMTTISAVEVAHPMILGSSGEGERFHQVAVSISQHQSIQTVCLPVTKPRIHGTRL